VGRGVHGVGDEVVDVIAGVQIAASGALAGQRITGRSGADGSAGLWPLLLLSGQGARAAGAGSALRPADFHARGRTVVGCLHGAAVGQHGPGPIERRDLLHGDGFALAVVILDEDQLGENLSVDDPGIALFGLHAGVALGEFFAELFVGFVFISQAAH
jgi:hypothetical protein